MDDLEQLVATEIVTLHSEFQAWFSGESARLDRVDSVLAPEMTLLSPDGSLSSREEIVASLLAARGSRPMRIRIENPVVRSTRGDVVLATYEEWQESAGGTTGRRSSVVFVIEPTAPGGLLWLHVHETWIQPPAGDST